MSRVSTIIMAALCIILTTASCRSFTGGESVRCDTCFVDRTKIVERASSHYTDSVWYFFDLTGDIPTKNTTRKIEVHDTVAVAVHDTIYRYIDRKITKTQYRDWPLRTFLADLFKVLITIMAIVTLLFLAVLKSYRKCD